VRAVQGSTRQCSTPTIAWELLLWNFAGLFTRPSFLLFM
jgi:hypothetical protein